ncbi:glucosaminidase domain-containing protein [Bacteroides xylanisolvens]|mgnify:FL=1|uniref:glucosaminidase domain-containing protein n=1 Tax=Bacteroides xylanisolvens TaxID=371601 RepID=UPI0039B45616
MRCLLIISLLSFVEMMVMAQSTSDIQSYISQYKQIALEQEKQYGIPASITLAQGILESGAGKSALTRNANNHFGVKAYGGWTGPVYLAWDDEEQKSRFRKYSSATESFRDHVQFLKNNSRYNSLFSKSVYDYRAWAIGLQEAGYATARNYAKALIGFIDAYKLYAINGGVKLRAGKTVTITQQISTLQPVFDTECILSDSEESEEEIEVTNIVKKYVVDINGIRCTILYPGENLVSIVQKHDISLSKLLEYNELSTSDDMKEGDIVYLEKKKKKYLGLQETYRVKGDETLYDISQHFGIRLASLAKLNGIDIFSKLREGDVLYLQ